MADDSESDTNTRQISLNKSLHDVLFLVFAVIPEDPSAVIIKKPVEKRDGFREVALNGDSNLPATSRSATSPRLRRRPFQLDNDRCFSLSTVLYEAASTGALGHCGRFGPTLANRNISVSDRIEM